MDETSAIIGRTRDRRSNYVKFVNHGETEVPTKPYPITLRYIQMKMVQENEILKIIEVFKQFCGIYRVNSRLIKHFSIAL